MITLVLGARRSGKSAWAESEAERRFSQGLLYLATAVPQDEGMHKRVLAHKARRGAAWSLLEEPLDLAGAISSQQSRNSKLLFIDCVSIWLSNLIFADKNDAEILSELDKFSDVLGTFPKDVFLISNEVGMGVAPSTELGNRFADLSGVFNQRLASIAHEVFFVVAGLPLCVKTAKI